MRKTASVMIAVCLLLVGSMAHNSKAEPANVLYVHPMSLIISTAIDILPAMITVTYERHLQEQNALILSPNFIFWNLSATDEELKMNGYGLGVGYRHYLSSEKKTHGMYLQAKSNIGYSTAEYTESLTGIDNTTSGSGMGLDLLFYIGTKGQWNKICMFFDFGLGYSYSSYELGAGNISTSGTGLGWEFNLGLGYAF